MLFPSITNQEKKRQTTTQTQMETATRRFRSQRGRGRDAKKILGELCHHMCMSMSFDGSLGLGGPAMGRAGQEHSRDMRGECNTDLIINARAISRRKHKCLLYSSGLAKALSSIKLDLNHEPIKSDRCALICTPTRKSERVFTPICLLTLQTRSAWSRG